MINADVSLSFDQYGRYFILAKIVDANRTKKSLKILDVGGKAGSMSSFLPNDEITILDVIESQEPNYIQGDALAMPFADRQFDMVVTADTLEHIKPIDRKQFLAECYRVSNGVFLLAAPFETGHTQQAEREVNEVYKSYTGQSYIWLKEHLENGLPKPDLITNWVASRKLKQFHILNNNIEEWKALISQFFTLENLPSRKGRMLFEERSAKYNATRNQYPAVAPAYRYIFAISERMLKKPIFTNIKSDEDFKSLIPIAKTVRYHLEEQERKVPDQTYLRAAMEIGAYIAPEKARDDLLVGRIKALENEIRQITLSLGWQWVMWLNSRKIQSRIARLIWIGSAKFLWALRYKVYLNPLNLIWRLRTGVPAYGRQKIKLIQFPEAKKPDVSIVIPIYGKAPLTINCLTSLLALKTNKTLEVIVVDDCSKDASPRLFSSLPGVVYIRNDKNSGFVKSCNAGARHAKGKFLVFLNNDTEVDSEWLDPLIDRLNSDVRVGLVGSKLLYPSGLLQEAGGIIFADGSGWNYGKGAHPDDYQYCYAREVDYCSGASIAIRRQLFEKLGRFDTAFAPAYYEDTDLSFSVRAQGLRVIYEPASKVTHFEGATAGTDLSSGMKRYQAINQAVFYQKWQAVLEQSHYLSSKSLIKARDRAATKMALVIDHLVPEPDKDSGSVRMDGFLTMLQELGYKVSFWPQNLNPSQPYTRNLQSRGIEVVYGGVDFLSFSYERGASYDLVVLSRPSVAPSYLDIVRSLYVNAKIIYDTVDLAFLRVERQAQVEENSKLSRNARMWRDVELGIIQRVDATLVVSTVEKKLLSELLPSLRTAVVSNIHKIRTSPGSYGKRTGLLFIGGYAHHPNVDAVLWFCNDVLPLIIKEIPNIIIRIVGSNPPPSLYDLASENVRVMGYVHDVDALFNSSKVFVAPLRYGAGVKGKIGQAVEYGLPVVSTTIGIEGMYMKDGRDCLVADDAETFAQAVVDLYNDKAKWENISANSQKVISQHFSLDAAKRAMKSLLENIKTE